jgi:Domain of unknown function (DUF1877)
MSQQLLMWSVSPFLIQQLETEGVRALEVFWNADEDFDVEDYWSEALKLNAEAISNEGIDANERENIEIQGNWAGIIHSLLTGDDDDSTLTGTKDLDFIVREEVISENSWCLVNALVGAKKVRDSDDYVASYLSPEQTKNISLALAKIGNEDFDLRCNTFFSESKERRFAAIGDAIYEQVYASKYIAADISEAEEFIKSELIPLYSKASEQQYGILIAWSI